MASLIKTIIAAGKLALENGDYKAAEAAANLVAHLSQPARPAVVRFNVAA